MYQHSKYHTCLLFHSINIFIFSYRFSCFIVYLNFFFFNDTATTEIYTLSLHDALPISTPSSGVRCARNRSRPWRGGCEDRKSTRLNSSHEWISYAVFCLKKKKKYCEEPTTKKQKKQVTTRYGRPC